MNLMMYVYKRDFNVQKAERFFKERGIKYQLVDMKKKAPGQKELKLFAQRLGVHNLIDKDTTAYRESTLQFLREEGPIMEALERAPAFLRQPIVRDGQRVTVGYAPDVWQTWIES